MTLDELQGYFETGKAIDLRNLKTNEPQFTMLRDLLYMAGYHVGRTHNDFLFAFDRFKQSVHLSQGQGDPQRYVIGTSSFNALVDKALSQTGAGSRSSDVVLKVPFYPQTDNLVQPHRTCNTSACAMVAKYLGANIKGDDDYFTYVQRHGDTTDHNAQTKALADVGIKSTFHTDLGIKDLHQSIDDGLPVVIALYHRGTLQYPTGGHVIVAIGYTGDKKNIIVNDPYGSLNDGYTGSVYNGRGAKYSNNVLTARWSHPHGVAKASGYGRLFRGN